MGNKQGELYNCLSSVLGESSCKRKDKMADGSMVCLNNLRESIEKVIKINKRLSESGPEKDQQIKINNFTNVAIIN